MNRVRWISNLYSNPSLSTRIVVVSLFDKMFSYTRERKNCQPDTVSLKILYLSFHAYEMFSLILVCFTRVYQKLQEKSFCFLMNFPGFSASDLTNKKEEKFEWSIRGRTKVYGGQLSTGFLNLNISFVMQFPTLIASFERKGLVKQPS